MPFNTPTTWVTGAVTASQFNAQIRDNVTWLKAALTTLGITSDAIRSKITPAFCGASVHKSSLQTITTSTNTPITFDNERVDSDFFHSTSSNTSRLTIPSGMGGYYMVQANVTWEGNATGVRTALIRMNGSTLIARSDIPPVGTGLISHNISRLYLLTGMDYVELVVTQTSGIDLDILATGDYSPEFTIFRVSGT